MRRIEFYLHEDGRFRAGQFGKDFAALSYGRTFLDNTYTAEKTLNSPTQMFSGIMSANTSREAWYFVDSNNTIEDVRKKVSAWRKRARSDSFNGVGFKINL